jgi:hypothetical protein
MNGTADVLSASSWKRVFRAKVLTAGSAGENVGTITVTGDTVADRFVNLSAGVNQSQIACFTIPDGYTAVIRWFKVSIARANSAAGSAEFRLLARNEGGVYRALRREVFTTSESVVYDGPNGITLPARTDVITRIESVASTNTEASAVYDYLLIEDS